LKYSSLKDVSELIIKGIQNKKTIKKTKAYIRNIIETAISNKSFNKEDLNDYLKNDMWPTEFAKPNV
ncbi:MAG TPA: hypothetical protein VNX01_15610, partial [Bacteroidia bacterium]|nr:hypothetical protein [Bacteroidia bacterium]